MLRRISVTFSRSPLYKAMLALLVVLAVVLTSAPVYAQSGSDGRLNTRRLDSFDSGEYDWDLSAELGEILTATADTDLYDPITIANLRILRDKAQPYWSEDDIDPERTRRVVRKALTVCREQAFAEEAFNALEHVQAASRGCCSKWARASSMTSTPPRRAFSDRCRRT